MEKVNKKTQQEQVDKTALEASDSLRRVNELNKCIRKESHELNVLKNKLTVQNSILYIEHKYNPIKDQEYLSYIRDDVKQLKYEIHHKEMVIKFLTSDYSIHMSKLT